MNPAPPALRCENCGANAGGLKDAHNWLGRPVCKACFDHLWATRSMQFRGFWMPVAIVAVAGTIGLAAALIYVTSRPASQTTTGAGASGAGGPGAGGPGAGAARTAPPPAQTYLPPRTPSHAAGTGASGVAPPPAPPGPTEIKGMSREQIVAMLGADRTWYWHWEERNKRRSLKFLPQPDGRFADSGDPQKMFTLEQRWVLTGDGHLFIPTNTQTLRGFFGRTGRQKGAFTEESLPQGAGVDAVPDANRDD